MSRTYQARTCTYGSPVKVCVEVKVARSKIRRQLSTIKPKIKIQFVLADRTQSCCNAVPGHLMHLVVDDDDDDDVGEQ